MKMNENEIPIGLRFSYIVKCDLCLIEQEILTQINNFPEYETEIYLKCQCGNYIEFILPVN